MSPIGLPRSTSLIQVLAATGGACWVAKSILIWANGGTNTTGGIVGVLFLAGTVLLAIAAAIWAWKAAAGRSGLIRILAVVGALVGLFLAINLPILIGLVLMPGSWLAEELGVIVLAVAAIVAGPLAGRIRSRQRARAR